MLVLRIFRRDNKRKAKLYLKEGKIPGVVYGKDIENTSVYAEKKDFLKFYKEYESGLIEVILDSQKFQGLIQEVQFDPLSDEIIHFDVFIPSQKNKIRTKIPLRFVGTSEGVNSGGILNINFEEVEIECLPQDIPSYLEVNLEKLKSIGDSVYIKDIDIPPNIKVLYDPETPIVSLIKETEIPSKEISS